MSRFDGRVLRAARGAAPDVLRGVALGGALVAAVVLQGAVLARLGLPGGPPPLVLVVVVAVALGGGPATGAATGFAGGLLLDLAPGGTGTVGEAALALVLVGAAIGALGRRVAGRDSRTPLPTAVAVAAAAAAALVLVGAAEAVVLARAAQAAPTWEVVLAGLPAQGAYAVLLALGIVPLQRRLARRRRGLRLRLALPLTGGSSDPVPAPDAAPDAAPHAAPDAGPGTPALAPVTVLPTPPRPAPDPAPEEELDLGGPADARRRDAS